MELQQAINQINGIINKIREVNIDIEINFTTEIQLQILLDKEVIASGGYLGMLNYLTAFYQGIVTFGLKTGYFVRREEDIKVA